MKSLKYLVIALLISPMFMSSTGCKDDTPAPIVTPKDTVPDPEPITNRFTLGFDQFDLEIDNNSTSASLRQADGLTIINVVGNSTKKTGTPIVSGRGEFEIKVAARTEGTYRQADKDDVELEVATGEGNRRKTYSFDQNSNIVVTITKFDTVGGYLEGKFSGTLKDQISTGIVKSGEFRVKRGADK